MGIPQFDYTYTVDQYLAFEEQSDIRHEFLDGLVYAMAGESLEHSTICSNLVIEVGTQLKGTRCRTLSPNMKVLAGENGLFAYPDVTVMCGEPVFVVGRRDVIINPSVIFEVLSPATEAFDRGEKFLRYRTHNKTLTDYILVSQRKPLIEHFFRQASGEWGFRSVEHGILDVASINCKLRLSEVYDRIIFPAFPETMIREV